MVRKILNWWLVCFGLIILFSCVSISPRKIKLYMKVPDRDFEKIGKIIGSSCQGFESSARPANEGDALDSLRREAAKKGADAVILSPPMCYPRPMSQQERKTPGGCIKEIICTGTAVKFTDSEKE